MAVIGARAALVATLCLVAASTAATQDGAQAVAPAPAEDPAEEVWENVEEGGQTWEEVLADIESEEKARQAAAAEDPLEAGEAAPEPESPAPQEVEESFEAGEEEEEAQEAAEEALAPADDAGEGGGGGETAAEEPEGAPESGEEEEPEEEVWENVGEGGVPWEEVIRQLEAEEQARNGAGGEGSPMPTAAGSEPAPPSEGEDAAGAGQEAGEGPSAGAQPAEESNSDGGELEELAQVPKAEPLPEGDFSADPSKCGPTGGMHVLLLYGALGAESVDGAVRTLATGGVRTEGQDLGVESWRTTAMSRVRVVDVRRVKFPTADPERFTHCVTNLQASIQLSAVPEAALARRYAQYRRQHAGKLGIDRLGGGEATAVLLALDCGALSEPGGGAQQLLKHIHSGLVSKFTTRGDRDLVVLSSDDKGARAAVRDLFGESAWDAMLERRATAWDADQSAPSPAEGETCPAGPVAEGAEAEGRKVHSGRRMRV